MHRLCILLALCVSVLGCSDPQRDATEPFVQLALQDSIAYDRTGADTTLLMPAQIRAAGDELLVSDDAGPSLRLLGRDGALRTVLGRNGSWPGEFRQITAVAALADTLVVADRANARISHLSRSGASLREVPYRAGLLSSIAVDTQGRTHVASGAALDSAAGSGRAHIVVVDATGSQVAAYGDYEAQDHPMAASMHNQVRLAPVEGGTWVLYTFRGVLTKYAEDGSIIRSLRLPAPKGHGLDAPYVQPLSPDGMSVAVGRLPVAEDVGVDDDGRLFVLLTQVSDAGDLYSEILALAPTGEILTTSRLPHAARSLAVVGRTIYALRAGNDGATGIDVVALSAR